ncbi:MAG TPA: amino acid permease [Sphingomicrobium sp.]|nr:amino acid permease [Sphingomicrobium sp.]
MADTDEGKIGLWMTTALVIGSIIGAGIFMLPVALAPLGANAVFGWLISGVGALCIAYGMARLSRLGDQGIQANVEQEFGPIVAFLVAWSFWVSNCAAQASIAIGTASALSFVGVDFGGQTGVLQFAIFWLVALTALNAAGVRAVGGFSIVTVAIKILPLLAVIWLFAERGVRGQPYVTMPSVRVDFANIAAATALTFYTLTGFEAATTPVGKVRDAGRTIPRAVIGGTALVVILYVFAGTGLQLLLPVDVIVNSPAPFADALVAEWGNGAAIFAALTIAVAAIGCLNGLILCSGELAYSMALRGDLPSILTKTRGINTPVVAQIASSGLSLLLLLANSSRTTANLFTFVILVSTAAVVVVYLASVLAAWKASPAPLSKVILAVALVFIAFAIYGIGLEPTLWSLALLAAGLAVRWIMRRLNSRASSLAPEAVPAAPRE